MEMEIVKPFGDHVASEEADVICLSKQKIKIHFFRWSVRKENQLKLDTRSLHPFPIEGPKSSSSPGNSSLGAFIDQKPPAINIPSTDVAKYSGSPSMGPKIIRLSSTTPSSHVAEKSFPYLVMIPEKVHSGYLYIYHPNAEGNERYEEFYVNDESKLIPISLTENEDVRAIAKCPPELDRYEYAAPTSSTRGENSNEIWVALSPVQWKYSYLVETCNNLSQRKNRMQKVVCEPLKNKRNPNAHSRMIWYFSEGWMSKDDFSREEASSMEVLLDDPIHIAEQISKIIDSDLESLARLVKSIEFGISPEQVGSLPEDYCDEDAQYLHLLAITSYKFAFSSNDNIDTYTANTQEEQTEAANNLLKLIFYYPNPERDRGDIDITRNHGIDKDLIKKLLAIKERAELSLAIHAYRNDLGVLLISDRYQDRLTDYLCNIETRKHYGKCIAVTHLATLTRLPSVIDKHLRLDRCVDNAKTDIWLRMMGLIEIGDRTIARNTVALINSDIELELFFHFTELENERSLPVSGIDRIDKDINDVVAINLSRCVTDFSKDLAEARAAWMPTVVKPSVFSLTIDGYQTLYKIPKNLNATDIALERNGKFIKDLLDSNRKHSIKAEIRENEIRIFTKKNKIKIQNCTIRLGEAPKKLDKVLIKLVDSDHFRSVELLLLLLDINQLVREAVSRDSKSVSEYFKEILSGTKHLTDAASITTRHRLSAPVKNLSLSRKIFSLSTRASSFLGVVISIMDVKIAEDNGDDDAALAFGASAILSAVGMTLGIAVGWPAFILAAGFTALAIYLTDSELESYFKSFPLRKADVLKESLVYSLHMGAKSTITYPYQAVRTLCEFQNNFTHSKIMTNYDRSQYNFEMYYVLLTDFLCPLKPEIWKATCYFEVVLRNGSGGQYSSTTEELGRAEELFVKFTSLPKHLVAETIEKSLEVKVFTHNKKEIRHQRQISFVKSPFPQNEDSGGHTIHIPINYDLGEGDTAYILVRMRTPDGYMPMEYRGSARYVVCRFSKIQPKNHSFEIDGKWFHAVEETLIVNSLKEFLRNI